MAGWFRGNYIENISLPFTIKKEGGNVDFSALTGSTTWNLSVVYSSTGCSSSPIRLTIPEPDEITVTQANIEASCAGDNITLIGNVEGGTPYSAPEQPYIYKWKFGEEYLPETTNSLEVSEEGTYELEIFDANGCGYNKTIADGHSFAETFYADFPAPLDIFVENATDSDGPNQDNGSVTLGSTFTESFVEYSINGSDYQPQPFF
jgi:hypothetical protein